MLISICPCGFIPTETGAESVCFFAVCFLISYTFQSQTTAAVLAQPIIPFKACCFSELALVSAKLAFDISSEVAVDISKSVIACSAVIYSSAFAPYVDPKQLYLLMMPFLN